MGTHAKTVSNFAKAGKRRWPATACSAAALGLLANAASGGSCSGINMLLLCEEQLIDLLWNVDCASQPYAVYFNVIESGVGGDDASFSKEQRKHCVGAERRFGGRHSTCRIVRRGGRRRWLR